VSREVTYYCQGPDCDTHVTSTEPPPVSGFLVLVIGNSGEESDELDFCGWPCLLTYGRQGQRPAGQDNGSISAAQSS
jgi:hypothetical protein